MVVWLTRTSTEYQALDYVDEYDVRGTRLYMREESSTWRPFYVVYATDVHDDMDARFERVPNFPSIPGNIACDEEAKLILEDLVHDHVEFLPLLSNTIKDKVYYILYPKTVLDCLDTNRSEFVRLQSGYIRGVRKYSFISDCIGDTPIFRLPFAGSLVSEPFVNNEFKQMVEDNKLTGLEFTRVWEG